MIPESAFGHGDFMMIRAELVRVVGGAAEALVAATVFWRANLVNANAYERDGYVWWNASQTEIAELTGLTLDQVRRAGRSLTEQGMIEAARHQRAGIQDRSYSYRVVSDTPMRENADFEAGESPLVEAGESPLLPSSKTVKTTTTGATRQKQWPGGFAPDNSHCLKALARGVDVDVEFLKFQDYHLARGSKFVDWGRAFHTWLNNARPEPGAGGARQRPGTAPPRTPTDRMNAVMAIQDPTEQGMIE